MIDAASFGAITIEGRTYRSDIILFPDGTVMDGWWRNKGHLLQAEDLRSLLPAKPELIVIGTGAHGRMRLHQDLPKFLTQKGIDFTAEPNSRAIETYNRKRSEKVMVAGCFHLTC